MPFDGLAIRAICKELNQNFINARIDKIYQPEKEELFFTLRQHQGGNTRLVISANARWARFHQSSERKENPSQAPSFCMLLRKHLEGGKIKAIEQVGFERIVHIHVEALDEFREWNEKILVCEFMGRHSNIILINPKTGIIIDAIKRFGSDVNSYREVYPGKEYKSPPTQDKKSPLETSFADFYPSMWEKEGRTLASALFSVYSGISSFSAAEICKSCGFDPEMPVEQCGEIELSNLYYRVRDLIAAIGQGEIQPTVLSTKSGPQDFCPFLPAPIPDGTRFLHFETMNECSDYFYLQKLSKIRLENMKLTVSRKVKEQLDKAYKRRFLQDMDQSKAQDSEKYRNWGELLTAYAHQYKKGDKTAELEDFYTNEIVKIELSPRYTPIENAQKYFKIYNKSRGTLRHLQQRLQETNSEIEYLESVQVSIHSCETPTELDEIIEELEKEGYKVQKPVKTKGKSKGKSLRSEPRRFISSDNLEILVGRNNRQNDWLTLRQADRNDLWLHTKEIPGTHVIISLPKTCKSIHDVPDQTLEEAAALAAYFSKASESEKVPVDYTFRSNVRKPQGAKPGMVIYDHYWTLMTNPRSSMVQVLLEQLNEQ